MRVFLITAVLVISLGAMPASSHAFGLLKFVWDGVANQLGMDRGPVPKVIPKRRPPNCDQYGKRIPRHVYVPSYYMQAQGF